MSRKVSIIINCYNGEKYLKECLDSVINQSYTNWEIIFWDNQSKDNSSKIFKSYNDPRFKYFLSDIFTNLPTARNLAMQKIGGDYISFLDTDDFWNFNKLSCQVSILKDNNVDLVYSNYLIKNEKKTYVAKKLSFPRKNIINSLFQHYHIGLLTIIFKKKILNKFTFNENYSIITDFDLMINICKYFKVFGINEVLATYRVHNTNTTQENILKYALELSRWYRKNFHKYQEYRNISKVKNLARYEFAKILIKKNNKKSIIFFKRVSFSTKLKLILVYLGF